MAKSKSTRGAVTDAAPNIVASVERRGPPSNVVQLRLVPSPVSLDTVQMLEELLQEARKGKIVGLAFTAMYKRREYVVGYTGECARNPTFARGMVFALLEDLGHTNP